MHLAQRVAWKTTDPTAQSVCLFGRSLTMQHTATGWSSSYIPGGGYHHVAKLSPLPFDADIFYSCGDGLQSMSPPRQFRTAPLASTSFQPFRMAIYGDMGWKGGKQRPTPLFPPGGVYANWSATQTQQLLTTLTLAQDSSAIDLVWHVGDISYADV